MKKHYVEFYSPGTLFVESRMEPIDSWDVTVAVAMSQSVVERYGSKPHSFRFRTMIEHEPVRSEEGPLLKVQSVENTRSNLYHLGGQIETLDDIERRAFASEEYIVSNMRSNRVFVACSVQEKGR